MSAHEDFLGTEKLVVAVEVKATNTGNTPISIPPGKIRIVSIMSNPPIILLDGDMEERLLEPGESDQLHFHTYGLPVHIGTLQIETHVPGIDSDWETNSLFDVKPDSKAYTVTENAGKANK